MQSCILRFFVGVVSYIVLGRKPSRGLLCKALEWFLENEDF